MMKGSLANRYLVWGYYGSGNLGDELMLRAIAGRINARDPGSVVYVKCYNPPDIKGIIPFPLEKTRIRFPLMTTIVYLARAMAMMLRIDTLVIGGGTLFLDKGRHNLSMGILAVVSFFARLMGKRVCVIGVGIDILAHPLNMMYLRVIIGRSSYTTLRDDFSYTMAGYLPGSKNIKRTSDIIFDKSFLNSLVTDRRGGRAQIVVSLTDYYKDDRRGRLLDRSCELVEMLLREYADRYDILLCAFQKTLGERDYEFLDEIRTRVAERNRDAADRLLFKYIVTVEDAGEVFSGAAMAMGMRYHALVLSAIFRRPFIGIDIEVKIKEFCSEFGMPCIGVDEFFEKGIAPEAVEKALSRSIHDEALKRQMEMAEANFGWLK
jgi:polysaccharide pyruvyl transferase WcaK-like protein